MVRRARSSIGWVAPRLRCAKEGVLGLDWYAFHSARKTFVYNSGVIILVCVTFAVTSALVATLLAGSVIWLKPAFRGRLGQYLALDTFGNCFRTCARTLLLSSSTLRLRIAGPSRIVFHGTIREAANHSSDSRATS